MLPTVSQSPSSACIYIPRRLHGHDCFTVSSSLLKWNFILKDLGSQGYFSIWHHSWLFPEGQQVSLYVTFYASALMYRRHYVFVLSIRPSVHPSIHLSVHPKPEISSFHLYMGPLGHPTNCDHFAACPSIHLSVPLSREILSISWRTHGGNGLKLYVLMYLDHLQNWLAYDHSL